MQAGSQMVIDSGADLGIVFDTDVDRSAVVARDGEAINSNRYIALMSYIALRCGSYHKAAHCICMRVVRGIHSTFQSNTCTTLLRRLLSVFAFFF